MNRRTFLMIGAGAATWMLAGLRPARADLEPDGLSKIYRRYRLMIVGQRDDEDGIALAGAVVSTLAKFLPASRAQLARAEDARRVGVLIGTNQQDVAIMAADSANALFLAKAPFDDMRNVPLRLIVSFRSHVLVCRADLKANQVFLFAQTLAEHEDALPLPAGVPSGVVPTHPGSLAYFAGDTMPNSSTTG
jgi:hypothetical protein